MPLDVVDVPATVPTAPDPLPPHGLDEAGILQHVASAGLPGFVLALSTLPAWWVVGKVRRRLGADRASGPSTAAAGPSWDDGIAAGRPAGADRRQP